MQTDFKKLIVESFNEYTGPNTEVLDNLYDKDIYFEDPLTKVNGIDDLKKYYQHAYEPVKSIDFQFKNIYEAGLTFTCEWDMTLTASPLNLGKSFTVRGVSVITFSDKSHKIIRHHDYLDIGDMVYERIPGFGKLIGLLKSRLS